jgi:hypothetical protein
MILTDLLVIIIALLLLGLTALCLALAMGKKLKEERPSRIAFWTILSLELLVEIVFFFSYYAI